MKDERLPAIGADEWLIARSFIDLVFLSAERTCGNETHHTTPMNPVFRRFRRAAETICGGGATSHHLLTANFRAFLTSKMPENTKKSRKGCVKGDWRNEKLRKRTGTPHASRLRPRQEPATTMRRSVRQDVWIQSSHRIHFTLRSLRKAFFKLGGFQSRLREI